MKSQLRYIVSKNLHRRKTFLYTLLPVFVCCVVNAAELHAQDTMEYWLDQLDESLAHRDEYDQQRRGSINTLKQQLAEAKKRAGADLFDLNYALYNEYKSYCYDSARHYGMICLDIAQQQLNDNRIIESKQALVFSLISAGLLSEAEELLHSIDRGKLSGHLLEEYYELNAQLWRTKADYINQEPYYTQYITHSNAYQDSLLALLPPNSLKWWSHTGSKLMRNYKFREALEAFNHVMDNDSIHADIHLVATTTAEMAWAYIWQNNEEEAIKYFARSAIADNESATREITALYHLSRFIYKRGDYERASVYVHQALEDVNFYNTRLRKVEINDILPIIEQDRYNAIRTQRNWLFAASGLFLLLMGVILSSYLCIRRKNRTLAEARETIAGQLEQLQRANEQLKEADKIKTAYIGRSFYINAEYIEKVEKLFLAIDRKITTRQYEDLRSTLKQSTLNAERESMYETFDQTFIKLFPDFVEKYNALFEEKDRRQPANDHSLTSEMRIFALIRLGITDSERIAKFLDYSVHTVNTYKTRIKNRSTVDNDKFESIIMTL